MVEKDAGEYERTGFAADHQFSPGKVHGVMPKEPPYWPLYDPRNLPDLRTFPDRESAQRLIDGKAVPCHTHCRLEVRPAPEPEAPAPAEE
jgi:hypothetical protein